MDLIDEINIMPEEELEKLVATGHFSFLRHVSETCLRGGVPEYSKGTVEENLAIKHGMVKYKGIYTKLVGVIPDRIKKIIDSKSVKPKIVKAKKTKNSNKV